MIFSLNMKLAVSVMVVVLTKGSIRKSFAYCLVKDGY